MKYFSLFTGIGGLDSGLEKMGAECVGFSEIRESSINIYKQHFPDHVGYGDVTKIDFAALPDFDVLTGGFPCQSFSLAGVRAGFEDRRGKMIFYIADLLAAKRPKFAALENVKGILTHDGGQTKTRVFQLLQSVGYHVRVVLLNSAHYGSAQSRERVIFLCSLKDFPKKVPEIRDDTKRFRDVRDAEGPFEYVKDNDRNKERLYQRSDHFFFNLLGGYDRTNTILTMKHGDQRRPHVVQEAEGVYRYLTVLEGERLQGFTDGWTKVEKEANRWFAIGNAVNCRVSDYLFTDYLKGVWW